MSAIEASPSVPIQKYLPVDSTVLIPNYAQK